MYNSNFEYVSSLQYRVKSLTARVKAFESGDRYIAMRAQHKSELAIKDREIRRLKLEIADANSRAVAARNSWLQVVDDLDKEREKAINDKNRDIASLKRRLFETERKLDTVKDSLRGKTKELYRALTDLEDEKGRNQKLKAQIARDYENSSIPSSEKRNRKKIVNNREKTGRKPGGQPGHKGHRRKALPPTNVIHIPVPEKYADRTRYRPTGKTIAKQMVNIRMDVIVNEYQTPELRIVRTGQRIHAPFPDGMTNEVNYGGSVKAFAFLLNTRYCVSTDKVRELLSQLTGGRLEISTGMINGLCKAFSSRTQAEQKAMFSDLLVSPVMNVDFTTANLNGKNTQILVCATPKTALFLAREHKGHEGVKGSPIQDYQGTLVHDHDRTFYSYGGGHQECLSHTLRYLKDSMINEPNLKWNTDMRRLIQDAIHYRNSLDPDVDPDPEKVKAYEDRYQCVLLSAKEEYEYEPPGKYYIDGYNLYKRLAGYKDNHLSFLYEPKIPVTNNLSERLLRIFKRKQRQAMAFRSFDNLGYLCDSMGIIESMRFMGMNLYSSTSSIFDNTSLL